MVLAAVDVPGLLAEVAGVLHANRIDVLDAAIYSRDATPELPAEALDIFLVRDGYGRPVTDEASWRKIRDDLEAVIRQGQGRDLLSRRRAPSRWRRGASRRSRPRSRSTTRAAATSRWWR